MSAPDTNIKKQRRRHFGPLLGILFVLAFVGIAVFAVPAFAGDQSAKWAPVAETLQNS